MLRTILDQALSRPDCDAVIPHAGGRFEPLCAVYHQRALPAIEAALDSKTFKIMEALRAVRVFPVEIAAPDAFRNVNTPEEWDALLAEKPA
jgi:molybdopterin-guanine dinucleotide biosynthesis protein A